MRRNDSVPTRYFYYITTILLCQDKILTLYRIKVKITHKNAVPYGIIGLFLLKRGISLNHLLREAKRLPYGVRANKLLQILIYRWVMFA